MPLFKDYGDHISKWVRPTPENFEQGWKWRTIGKTRWDWDNDKMREFPEPTLQRSSTLGKPGRNVYEGRNCLGLVFGWTSVESLSIPYLSLSLDNKRKIPKETLRAPMNCFVVFVGGRFLKDVDSVVERAEDICEEFYVSEPEMYFFEYLNDEVPRSTKDHLPKVRISY